MTDQLEGDAMMLDDWEEEHEGPETVHSKQFPGLVCFCSILGPLGLLNRIEKGLERYVCNNCGPCDHT